MKAEKKVTMLLDLINEIVDEIEPLSEDPHQTFDRSAVTAGRHRMANEADPRHADCDKTS